MPLFLLEQTPSSHKKVLSCNRNFAESPFTMKAYDTTVIYAKDNQGNGTRNHNFRNLRQKNKA
jgi:hypothetical protein